MKRLIIAILCSLALVGGCSPTPASAATLYDKTWCVEHGGQHVFPYGGYDTIVCYEIQWRKQGDGDGIYVTDVWTDVNLGCGDLENFPKIKNQYTVLYTSGTFNKTRAMADVDCHAHYNFDIAGPDTGPLVFYWNGEINLDHGANFCDTVNFQLKANGDTDRVGAGTDTGSCA